LTIHTGGDGGYLSGRLDAAGQYTFAIQVQDSHGLVKTETFSLDVFSEPLIATPVVDTTITGNPFSLQFQAIGTPPLIWDIDPSGIFTLPFYLTFSNTGLLSGTPPGSGNSIIPIRVTDASGRSDTYFYNIRYIQRLSFPSGTTALLAGNVEFTYFQYLPLSGGLGPYTISVTTGLGSLPPGLNVISAGLASHVYGTPTAPGSFSFTVEARDSLGQVASGDFSVLIRNDVIFTDFSAPYGVVSRSYQDGFAAMGGVRPYAWAVTSGNLPPGLALDPSSGQVSGTPAQDGTFMFSVQASDSASPPNVATGSTQILVRPVLSFPGTTLPDGAVNRQYNTSLSVTGGSMPPHQVRVTSGSLPPGLSLLSGTSTLSDGSIVLIGQPSSAGPATFTLEVQDNSSPPFVESQTFSLQVNPTLIMDPNGPPGIFEGQSLTYTFMATGGVPPYAWSLQNPVPGFTLDPVTGVFSGTGAQPYGGGLTVTVSDKSNPPQRETRSFNWGVAELLRIATSLFPPVTVGVPVRVYPLSRGCCGVANWSVSSGSLPPGLVLADPLVGEIAGTPTSVGTFTFTLQATNNPFGGNPTADRTFSWEVKPQGSLGRNDSIATATPLSNGYYEASLSPAADAAASTFAPDNDYYRITANAGAVVEFKVFPWHLGISAPTLPVLEILDSAGNRLVACNQTGQGSNFSIPCLEDNALSSSPTVELYLKVPGTAGTAVTFFARVLDWTGDARPELFYTLYVSGAN
jgi:hypothetical protein